MANRTSLRLPTLTLLTVLGLSSCSKSPEAAAQEVCDCMGKISQGKTPDELLSNSAKCQELVAKYQGKYSSEDQLKFSQATAECVVKGMSIR